ncbi:hypothetical protein [Paenibacillus tuaregi]|uniref:hypothetical protein n=1 Tax=Paenibacillus tuaregi TaxID=1816681 RepID=UPI0008391F20|nr:hypothetical protein [Paenibacillus tuaregi]
MNMNKKIAAVVLTAVLTAAAPAAALGASLQLTDTVKTTVEKTAASADAALKSRITSAYTELGTLLSQETALDNTIKGVHFASEQALVAVRKEIKLIDANKVAELTSKVQMTKDKYKPLFVLYSSVSGTKKAGELKIAVQLAREDIRLKEKQLKAAKDEKARKIKGVRSTLSAITGLKLQIKSAKGAADVPKKRLSAEWSDFKQLAKKGEAKRAADSLDNLVSLTRRILEQKKGIHALENKISGVIATAKQQISAAK